MSSSHSESKVSDLKKQDIKLEIKITQDDSDIFAKECLSLFNESKENNVANAMSKLSDETRMKYLHAWSNSNDVQVKLLYEYYTLNEYVRHIADRKRYHYAMNHLAEVSKLITDNENKVPKYLSHAMMCLITLIKGEYDKAVPLLQQSTLHLNLSKCRFNWPLDFQYPNKNEKHRSSNTLKNMKFRYANLEGAIFKRTPHIFFLFLCGGDWSWNILSDVDFTGSNLVNADFRGCTLKGTTFKDANLIGANFDKAILCANTEKQLKEFVHAAQFTKEFGEMSDYFKSSPPIEEYIAAIYLSGSTSELGFISRRRSLSTDKFSKAFEKMLDKICENFKNENEKSQSVKLKV